MKNVGWVVLGVFTIAWIIDFMTIRTYKKTCENYRKIATIYEAMQVPEAETKQ